MIEQPEPQPERLRAHQVGDRLLLVEHGTVESIVAAIGSHEWISSRNPVTLEEMR